MASFPNELPPAILIVDNDLGFLVWLGLALGAGGLVTVPSAESSQAKQLIAELGVKINLAIVNPSVPGMSELTDSLKRLNPSLKVIVIQDSIAGPTLTIKAEASHSRSKLGWVTLVRRILGIEKATGVP